MTVLSLVPCAQDDPLKCKHNLTATCSLRDATHENLRLADLNPEDYQDALCMVEDREGHIILCRYCGSFKGKRDGSDWNYPSANRKVIGANR